MFYFSFWPLIVIILLIVLFNKISVLSRRVSSLESKLFSGETFGNFGTKVNQANDIKPVIQPVAVTENKIIQDDFTSSDGPFVNWLKEDWLQKLGSLLLLIGLGWFTTYAFMNNWIGPVGRITLGLILGLIVLILGHFRIKKYLNQGGVFLTLGSAIILLTIFAGQSYYQMFIPAVALAIMFLSTAFVALQSVKNNSLSLGLSGLVLAVLAPLFSGNLGGPHMIFNYLLVVTLGAIWIVAIKKNWGAIVLANLVAVFFYSLPIISGYSYHTNNPGLINYAYIFTLIFFLNSLINIWRSREGDLKAFLWTAVINSIFVLTWIMSFTAPEWQSLIVALWMIIFAIGAFVLFAEVKIPTVFYVYSGVAVMFLAVATALELEGSALTLAYIIEGALIPIIIRLITKDLRVMIKTSLILIAPAILAAGNLFEYFDSREVMNKEFFVVLFMVAALMIVGSVVRNYRKIESIDTKADSFLLIVGSVFAYGLIWAFISNLLSTDPAVATAISLIVFTVIGLVKYFYGIIVSSKILKNYGAILLGLVVARLILVDVWSMDMGARIFVFILIGVLLISTAFISRRIKQA